MAQAHTSIKQQPFFGGLGHVGSASRPRTSIDLFHAGIPTILISFDFVYRETGAIVLKTTEPDRTTKCDVRC